MATFAADARKRFQFDSTSGSTFSSMVFNCGPACAAMIAGYYNDNYPGIEATRRLVAAPSRPTQYTEQRDMLIARGVPATLVQVSSLEHLRSYVGTGRRPVILAVEMSRVPLAYRDHSFQGWHAVVCLAGPGGGFWINDPNFSPSGGARPDPDSGRKWWPDWVMYNAFISNYQSYAIVPNNPKPFPVPKPPPAPTYPSGFPRRGWVGKGVTAWYVDGRYHHTTTVAGAYTFIGSQWLVGTRYLVYPTGTRGRVMFRSDTVRWI